MPSPPLPNLDTKIVQDNRMLNANSNVAVTEAVNIEVYGVVSIEQIQITPTPTYCPPHPYLTQYQLHFRILQDNRKLNAYIS